MLGPNRLDRIVLSSDTSIWARTRPTTRNDARLVCYGGSFLLRDIFDRMRELLRFLARPVVLVGVINQGNLFSSDPALA